MFNHCHISKYNVTLPLHINPNVNLVITTTGAKLKSGNSISAQELSHIGKKSEYAKVPINVSRNQTLDAFPCFMNLEMNM